MEEISNEERLEKEREENEKNKSLPIKSIEAHQEHESI